MIPLVPVMEGTKGQQYIQIDKKLAVYVENRRPNPYQISSSEIAFEIRHQPHRASLKTVSDIYIFKKLRFIHMFSINKEDVIVPLDVPKAMRETYVNNYMEITRGTGRLMLFAGDQKVEHLNDDFYGEGVPEDDADPEHLFRIASQAKIGVFATQLGLMARYGMDYRNVPYLVKVNSKTNLVETAQADPFSNLWYDVEQVVDFKENSGLNILGVGYTIYLGSEFEAEMLVQAAQIIYDAHQHGMMSVLWIYPRGTAVKDEKDPHLIAGATGVGACLGTDFVKVNYPKKEGKIC